MSSEPAPVPRGAEAAAWRLPLALILLAALALRLAWAAAIPVIPISDAAVYDHAARTIAAHGVYGMGPDSPIAYWPVGTSAIVAVLYALFGVSFGPIVALNVAVGTATPALAFALARRWHSTRAGLFAAAILAAWPTLVMFSTVIASETLFIFLSLAALLAWEGRWRRAWLGVAVTGLLFAAACYVRPIALLMPLVAALSSVALGRMAPRVAALRAGAAIVVILLAVAPWTARNAAVMGGPALVSTNFGPNLWMGNNPATTGGYQVLPPETRRMNEVERASYLKDAALAHIAAEPGAFVARTLEKAVILHAYETIGVAWNLDAIRTRLGPWAVDPLKVLASGYWFAALALAGYALGPLWRARGPVGALFDPAFLFWGYVTGIHAIVVAMDRYHLPAIPFVALLAGIAAARIAARVSEARAARPAAAAPASEPGGA